MHEILPNGGGARGNHAFHPASATSVPLVVDDQLDLESEEPAPPAHVSPADDIIPEDMPAILSGSDFTVPCIPYVPPSTVGSSIRGSGKCTHELSEDDMTNPPASTTLLSLPPASKKYKSAQNSGNSLMTSAGRASKLIPAAAVVGMQGSINHIGDILQGAVNAAQASSQARVTAGVTAVSSLDRAMTIMQTDDADLPPDDMGLLMTIFSAAGNERVTQVYVQSPHAEARRAYIKYLINAHRVAG